jgi:ankyrin repeat protein
LIDRGADVNAQEEDRRTPLHLASQFGYPDLAGLLIDCGANVNTQEEDRWTVLHLTSSDWADWHLEIAKLLIDHGANVDDRSCEQETLWYL